MAIPSSRDLHKKDPCRFPYDGFVDNKNPCKSFHVGFLTIKTHKIQIPDEEFLPTKIQECLFMKGRIFNNSDPCRFLHEELLIPPNNKDPSRSHLEVFE